MDVRCYYLQLRCLIWDRSLFTDAVTGRSGQVTPAEGVLCGIRSCEAWLEAFQGRRWPVQVEPGRGHSRFFEEGRKGLANAF